MLRYTRRIRSALNKIICCLPIILDSEIIIFSLRLKHHLKPAAKSSFMPVVVGATCVILYLALYFETCELLNVPEMQRNRPED